MSAGTNGAPLVQAAGRDLSPLSGLVLARICCEGGCTRTELVRDLAGHFAPSSVPAAEWRRAVEADAARLVEEGYARERRGRLSATTAGAAAAASWSGRPIPASTGWTEVRDQILVAKALGLESESPQKLKGLARPAGLRALVLQAHYGLPLRAGQSSARLRSELALVALERAFGNKIKARLGGHTGFSAKAARLLAGQLSASPRDFGTDGRLIAALAAEAAGAVKTDEASLRLALLRRLGARAIGVAEAAPKHSPASAQTQARPVPRAANDTAPVAVRPLVSRPDLAEFSADVLEVARTRAEGWPGNRKAFISHVWQAIRARRPEWALSEIEFKCMLAEAHRAGCISLANADLRNKANLKELRDSAVAYKNTVWHFVRVED